MEITNTTVNNIDHSISAEPIFLRINIPDKGIFEKRFTFKHDEKVWAAKEHVIHEIGKESKDIQNYGFFVPPHQGKAGKFMDEGRPLSEYSIPDNDQILEFMLKRRIYRSITFDENKLTKIHNKVNLRKLMELVEQNNAGQVNQFLEKGLDPNFQDQKTGETPLTTAAAMVNATEVIMFLINGGAYLDFRNRHGITAVHKAAAAGNGHNIKAFLDLGASPNYRDLKGLTPLYHACLSGKNPNVAEMLLADQADFAVVDSQGWQEIHQVCRYGHFQHLEQLIFYGADLNAQNGSGNTPLHICALYNQEDCSRLLLYRGAGRDIVNFANQTAEMVAVVATNVSLSVFIRNYSEKDVVPYIDKPTYSTRRRTTSKVRPLANSVFLRDSTDTFIFCSETLSTTSSNSLHSETSEPMSLDLSPREIVPQVQSPVEKSPTRKYRRTRTMSRSGSDSSYVTDSGDETGGSAYTTPLISPTNEEVSHRWRTYSLNSLNKEERSNVPRVKEVKGAANMRLTGKNQSRKTYVAMKNFTPTQAGELSLMQGDVVEVITKGDKGYWQGSVSGKKGWFPAECVDELKKRKHKSKITLHKPPSVSNSLNKSNASLDQPDVAITTAPQPRQVILQKVKAGFGFQMRGANAPTVNKFEFQPSAKIPALQYIGEVEPGGEAEKRGVKKGDFILEVNGNDVRTDSHRQVVNLIRKTGHNLIMKVMFVEKDEPPHTENNNITRPSGDARKISPPAVQAPGGPEKRDTLVVNGHQSKPPVPSRAPTTSLSRPRTDRQSVSDMNFEQPQNAQEDRIISIPRERVSPTDSQWHSPLTGHNSLPRRPSSSYGAIIGSTHEHAENATRKNYRPVEYVDNTGFRTLPSKPANKLHARRVASQDDSVVTHRRESSRSAKDRPKSWMTKVLPTAPPTTPPGSSSQEVSPDDLINRKEEAKVAPKGGEFKKDKKRRFSFRKKKEKDYTATAPANEESAEDEPGTEGDAADDGVTENLHIEGEEARPSSLPGLHKRLSTFKPVVIHNRQNRENEALSPELSQALLKRKTRASSNDMTSPVSPPTSNPPGHEFSGYHLPAHQPFGYQLPGHQFPGHQLPGHQLPGHQLPGYQFPGHQLPGHQFPGHQPPVHVPPHVPKSLEDSIKEEMMRRRCNTAPVSSIPMKPRRTFEYRKSGEHPDDGTEPDDQKSDLDSELAKAIARRAAKITSEPAGKPVPIYENIGNFTEASPSEPRSSVEEPPLLSIEEKLKMLHLQDDVFLPTKFKPPVQAPPGKGRPGKEPSRKEPTGNEPTGKEPTGKEPPKSVPPEKLPTEVVSTPHGKAPPKTLPKPKKKSSTSIADTNATSDVARTPRPVMTLPLSTEQQMTFLPPPILSPEMVATQFLDEVIDEEVKRSNWDTASWVDRDSPKSSNSSIDGALGLSPRGTPDMPPHEGQATSSGKKKYVYKITLVTETPADGSAPIEHAPVVTQVVSQETVTKRHVTSRQEAELPPPPPPPVEFHDESPTSFHPPVFTPPTSPPPPLLLIDGVSPGKMENRAVAIEDTPSPFQVPPPLVSHEPAVSEERPPPPLLRESVPASTIPPPVVPIETSFPLQEQPAPVLHEMTLHVPQEPPPPVPQEPPPPVPQEPPPPVPQEPPPPVPQEPHPPVPQEPHPPVTQELPAPVPQEPPPLVPQEPHPPVTQELPAPVPQEPPPLVPQEPPPIPPQELPPSIEQETRPPPPQELPPSPPQDLPPPIAQETRPSPPQEPPPTPPQDLPPPPQELPPPIAQKSRPPPPQEVPLPIAQRSRSPPPQDVPPPPQELPPPIAQRTRPPPPQDVPPPPQDLPPPPQEIPPPIAQRSRPPPPQDVPPPPQELPPPIAQRSRPPPPQDVPPPPQDLPPPPQEIPPPIAQRTRPPPPQDLPLPPQELPPSPPQGLPPSPQELPPPSQELPPPQELPPSPPQELPPPPQDPTLLPPQELPPPIPQEPPPPVSQELPSSPVFEQLPPDESSKVPSTSSLSQPIILAHTEDSIRGEAVVTGAAVSPPKEYQGSENADKKAGDDIIVPPPVFADSGAPNSMAPVEAQPATERHASEESEKSRTVSEQEESVVDGSRDDVGSAMETNRPGDSPDVPAPPGDITDPDENVVVTPTTMDTGSTEEQAPPEPVASDVSTNSSSFRDIPYDEWTCLHVCQWLASIGMTEHQELFQENDIRGVNLLGLTKQDLRELGVKKLGHRMTISDAVNTLTCNHGAATNL